MAVVRLSISTSEDVRDWYKAQAEEYGMSMSALMSYVMTQYKKNEESRELLKELNQASKTMNTEKMLEDMKNLVTEMNNSTDDTGFKQMLADTFAKVDEIG